MPIFMSWDLTIVCYSEREWQMRLCKDIESGKTWNSKRKFATVGRACRCQFLKKLLDRSNTAIICNIWDINVRNVPAIEIECLPPLAEVTQSGNDIRLFIQPFVNPSGYLKRDSVKRVDASENKMITTTLSCGYFEQNARNPSGAEIWRMTPL